MTFRDFDIDERCLSVLDAQGIIDPTPIQEKVLPAALTGADIVALAQTGTGKTLAFALPLLSRLVSGRIRNNMMLVLAPTRELAVQVHRVIEGFEKALGFHSVCVYGGVGYDEQVDKLRRGSAVIVATPGRLLDHMQRGSIPFTYLQVLVIDEADRMLDMGFMPDIRRILRKLPEDRQTILTSATFPDEIARLSRDMLVSPIRISVGAVSKPVDAVRQAMYTVRHESKLDLLEKIFKDSVIDSALIFMRTKSRTERVMKSLRRLGFQAHAIHGDRTQKQRQQALDGFREGRYKILVATDVAARGLDVEGISHVINYDIPENADDYIHRVGRTARANTEGDAITFVAPDDITALEGIERTLGRHIPEEKWEGSVEVLRLFTTPEEKTERVKRAGSRRRAAGLLRRR